MDDSPFNRFLYRTVVLVVAFFVAASLGTIGLTAVAEAARDLVGKQLGHAAPVVEDDAGAAKDAARLRKNRLESAGFAADTAVGGVSVGEISRAASPPAAPLGVNPPALTQDEINAPEPATLCLLLFGGCGVGILYGRRGRGERRRTPSLV